MHRMMNSSFYCTLAQNFCRQSPSCTNPSQFQIHFRYSSKTSVHLACQKRFAKNKHSLQHRFGGPGRKHCLHFIPCSLRKVFLTRKINYEHQILLKKKMSFQTRVAAQNVSRVGLSSLNRLTYSFTPRINKGCVQLRNLGVRWIGNPFSTSQSF